MTGWELLGTILAVLFGLALAAVLFLAVVGFAAGVVLELARRNPTHPIDRKDENT